MADDKKLFISTYSGLCIDLRNPQPETISIIDIAHGLSLLCRFCGQTRCFYSVAQHAVLVSRLVPEEAALAALLHDAHEAYVGDITQPVKEYLSSSDLEALSSRLDRAIAERFGVPIEPLDLVKRADRVALASECRDLLAPGMAWDLDLPDPDPRPIEPEQQPTRAERLFLRRFEELGPIPFRPKMSRYQD